MAMQKIGLGTIVTIAIVGLVTSVLGALVATQTFNNTATIKAIGVGVYTTSACTTRVTSLDWGTLASGESKTQTVYIKNEGSVTIVLSMTVGNWTPSNAQNYITVTWNRQSTTLTAGNVISASLTLSVSSSVSGITTFSFDITITGTEQT